MGLTVSHGAWDSAYSRFKRFREALAQTIGMRLEYMEGFEPYGSDKKGISWDLIISDPICHLLNHADNEGSIEWPFCIDLARRLRELAPMLEGQEDFQERAIQFAEGCEAAFENCEDLEFS